MTKTEIPLPAPSREYGQRKEKKVSDNILILS